VRLLLDTHVFIWWVANKPFGAQARSAISDADYVALSLASAWEMAIKRSLGRLDAPDDVEEQLIRHGFSPLPITLRHTRAIGTMPHHHKDPFDRLLVAQAQLEDLTIVTRDPKIGLYDVPTLAA
jgi:PIN domain nuclease of toxin-antitoxin system